MLNHTLAPASVATAFSPADDLLSRELIRSAFVRERFDPARVTRSLQLFPSPASVGQEVLSGPGLGFRDGRSFRVSVGPGIVQLRSVDAVRRERSGESERSASRREADLLAGELLRDGKFTDRPSQRYISEWSAKSRSRMVASFASADWSGLLADSSRPLGMLTLTYPGDWLTVCPSGRTLKRQLRAFLERWRRAVGSRLVGAWKLEFQRRGAPHIHVLTGVPAMVGGVKFEHWLSRTWAAVVDARDPLERARHLLAGTAVDFREAGKMTDPKRMAVYFLGHSTKNHDSKEYQHVVPVEWQTPETAPGRFWGFWGLGSAVEALDLDVADFVHARRILRRVAAGRARRVAHDRAYHVAIKQGWGREWAGRIARAARPRRRLRSLGVGGQLSGGFVVVNDGAQLGEDLARAVLANRGAAYPVRVGGSLVDPVTGELFS